MAEEFVGAVVLEWDGREIECLSVSSSVSTGKRIVKTMNRKNRAKGHAKSREGGEIGWSGGLGNHPRGPWLSHSGAGRQNSDFRTVLG